MADAAEGKFDVVLVFHTTRFARNPSRGTPLQAAPARAVRELLCNAAYAGYVSGLRDKSRAIKGLHEPIVSDELFDRVLPSRLPASMGDRSYTEASGNCRSACRPD
jgi:hypothetical protein